MPEKEQNDLSPVASQIPTLVGHTQIVLSDNRYSLRDGTITDKDGTPIPGGDTDNIGMGANHVGVVDQGGLQMKAKSQNDIKGRLTANEKAYILGILNRFRAEESGPAILPE